MTGKQRMISAFVRAILILDLSFFIVRENLPDSPLGGNAHELERRLPARHGAWNRGLAPCWKPALRSLVHVTDACKVRDRGLP